MNIAEVLSDIRGNLDQIEWRTLLYYSINCSLRFSSILILNGTLTPGAFISVSKSNN